MKKALASASAFFNEINPCGICEMRFAREIWLRHVKCLRAWVDLFHFTFCVSRKIHNNQRLLFHIRGIFHFHCRRLDGDNPTMKSNPSSSAMKKALASASAFFSEINPRRICEMRFVREIWLRHVKCLRA